MGNKCYSDKYCNYRVEKLRDGMIISKPKYSLDVSVRKIQKAYKHYKAKVRYTKIKTDIQKFMEASQYLIPNNRKVRVF